MKKSRKDINILGRNNFYIALIFSKALNNKI